MLSHRNWQELWTVTTAVQRTNERVNDITGVNPIRMNPYMTMGMIFIRVVVTVNLSLDAVRIYNGAEFVGGGQVFPPAGDLNEPVAQYAGAPVIGIGEGVTRRFQVPHIDGGAGAGDGCAGLMPDLYIMEYDTGVAGGTPTLIFSVWGIITGEAPLGTE